MALRLATTCRPTCVPLRCTPALLAVLGGAEPGALPGVAALRPRVGVASVHGVGVTGSRAPVLGGHGGRALLPPTALTLFTGTGVCVAARLRPLVGASSSSSLAGSGSESCSDTRSTSSSSSSSSSMAAAVPCFVAMRCSLLVVGTVHTHKLQPMNNAAQHKNVPWLRLPSRFLRHHCFRYCSPRLHQRLPCAGAFEQVLPPCPWL